MTTTMPDTFYPHLREVLDERFAALPDSAIESSFAEAFGEGVTPAEYEEFFSGLGRAFNSALPVLTSIGQGALSGAAAGSIAGPWGALGGALLGGAGGGLSHAKGPAGDVGRGLGGVVNLAGSLTGRGGFAQGAAGLAGMLGGGRPGAASPAAGGSAASVLGALLSRPETIQALRGLLAGRNPTVPIGSSGTAAPASAFAGLLGALSRETEAEAEAYQDAGRPGVVHGYLLDATGRPVVDPGDADLRAARLLALLALSGGRDRSTAGGEPAEGLKPSWGESFDDAFGEAFSEGLDGADQDWADSFDAWSPTATGYF